MRILTPDLSQDARRDIEAAIRERRDNPLGLVEYATADLPDATDLRYTHSLVWDTTVNRAKFSNGTDWNTIALSDAANTFTGTQTFSGAILGKSSIKSDSAAAGIGYATGAGDAVTQLTSKTTNVTINKICGKITTHNQSVAAHDNAQCYVFNSTIVTGDQVLLSISSGEVTIGSSRAYATGVKTGEFRLVVENITGAPLGEALVLTFIVIKGVSS